MTRPRVRRKHATFIMPAKFSRWLGVAALGIVLLGVVISLLPSDALSSVNLAVSRRQAPSTELYFAPATPLPKEVYGGESLPLAFTVRDLENQDLIYTYQITFTDAQGTVVLTEGHLALANQQSQTVAPQIIVPAGTGQGQVRVTLVGRSQTITTWLERSV